MNELSFFDLIVLIDNTSHQSTYFLLLRTIDKSIGCCFLSHLSCFILSVSLYSMLSFYFPIPSVANVVDLAI